MKPCVVGGGGKVRFSNSFFDSVKKMIDDTAGF